MKDTFIKLGVWAMLVGSGFIMLSMYGGSSDAASAATTTLANRLKGYVLLQVEQHGEAWYVNPPDAKRYYMKDGPAAYQLMRYYSLGISDKDLNTLMSGNAYLHDSLRGKILLQVQQHGEAYYVCPKNDEVIYIKDGDAAYQIMRNCSLGITDADLNMIPMGEVSATPPDQGSDPVVISGSAPVVAGCQVFPADNPWNQDISGAPVHPKSAAYLASLGTARTLHPDFGENQEYGIPFNVVPSSQALVPVEFTAYGDESDAGPYPLPDNARRESGSDRHVLVLQQGSCKLYELFAAEKNPAGGWFADSGALFDLTSNAVRPKGWTSADAAGLPVFPGLVRYEEVAAGEIKHAIRFTASRTQNGFIFPARHHAGTPDANLPPMGLRVRLKKDFDLTPYTGQARVILTALKKYGFILADNGSNWYFQGATDPGWNDDELNQLKQVPGSAFEAVYTGDIEK